MKVMEICDDMSHTNTTNSTWPSVKSLNPYHKTSYNTINDDLRKSGHGISYKETRFNENKWTEWAAWSLKQPSTVTSDIHKGITMTHILKIKF